MKNLFKLLGIITLAVVIGFGMMACGDGGDNPNNSTTGSGKYFGKDVLVNTYSLSVGSDARAAVKGDSFKMEVNTRGGKKNINGSVTNINADGTLTLKESGTNNTFTAIVDEAGNIGTVFSNNLAQSGFAPRTFDTIYLRALRWGSTSDDYYGENWGSGGVVLVKDFPANVSALSSDTDRYTLTISGTSDTKIEHFRVDMQGLTAKNEWKWLGKTTVAQNKVIEANVPFSFTVTIDLMGDFNEESSDFRSPNFMNYKEIIMEVNNLVRTMSTQNPETSEDYGKISSDIADGTIMATISNFNIVLKDTQKQPLTGSMGDYVYALKDDGISPEYRMVMWKLSAADLANAKQTDAKLEIGFKDGAAIENGGASLMFVWQDPVRGLWWQDDKPICGGEEISPDVWEFKTKDGVTWDKDDGLMTLDISSFVGNEFAAATEIRILIMCNWWNGGNTSFSIDELEIVSASITSTP